MKNYSKKGNKMKQGRLVTDIAYVNKIQKQIYEIVESDSKKIIPITNNKYIKAIFMDELNRYIVIDDYGNIMETANGWGYKSLESAEKAALYADMRAERAMRRHRTANSYDIDMEMADCYFGYNQADFY